jgi:hypothetical protein
MDQAPTMPGSEGFEVSVALHNPPRRMTVPDGSVPTTPFLLPEPPDGHLEAASYIRRSIMALWGVCRVSRRMSRCGHDRGSGAQQEIRRHARGR